MINSEQYEAMEPEQGAASRKYLTFLLDESYALDMSMIVEIIQYQPVTPVPETPSYIAGITNLRGTVLPVIDMRARLQKPEREAGQRCCVIVVRFEEMLLGLVVDNVTDLVDIPADKITPPPQVGNNYAHVFVREIGILDGEMTLIIDTDRLVNLDELAFLDEHQEG